MQRAIKVEEGNRTISLCHGMLRQWAESIVENGPNPDFRVPSEGQGTRCEGLSCYRLSEISFVFGPPESYAYGKEILFPGLGRPVILEFDVPEQVVDAAEEFGEVRFVEGTMIELQRIWPSVKPTARIIELEPRTPNS